MAINMTMFFRLYSKAYVKQYFSCFSF